MTGACPQTTYTNPSISTTHLSSRFQRLRGSDYTFSSLHPPPSYPPSLQIPPTFPVISSTLRSFSRRVRPGPGSVTSTWLAAGVQSSGYAGRSNDLRTVGRTAGPSQRLKLSLNIGPPSDIFDPPEASHYRGWQLGARMSRGLVLFGERGSAYPCEDRFNLRWGTTAQWRWKVTVLD